VAARVLTLRELNRTVLLRQLLLRRERVSVVKAVEHVAPQAIPAGALVTVPLPAPDLVTVSAKELCMKVAVTVAAAFIVAPMLLKESRDAHVKRFDVPGALLVTSGLSLLVYAITQAGQHGWLAGKTISYFAVSLALVLLMIPVVVRSSEEMLRIVPDDLREASYALGVPKWKTIMKIVLPTALSGIVGGVMMALARVMGETAPLLVLVGYSAYTNWDIFHGEQAALPLLMNNERVSNPMDPGSVGFDRIWGAALTLVLIIALINLLATVFARLVAPKKK